MQEGELCAVMSASDGRWRARPCREQYPSACRTRQGGWVLGEGGPRGGSCPEGAAFALPAQAKENAALHRAVLASGAQACWLFLQGELDACYLAGRGFLVMLSDVCHKSGGGKLYYVLLEASLRPLRRSPREVKQDRNCVMF